MPWYNKLICYYTPSDTTISRHYIPTDTANDHTPILILTQQSPTKLRSTINHKHGDLSPAAGGPLRIRTPGAAGRTPHQFSKTPNSVLLYCFSCSCHLCYPISASPKTHKPRGRASDVSTISTCFSVCYDLLPTPPPISVRKAGGITVVYLCGF